MRLNLCLPSKKPKIVIVGLDWIRPKDPIKSLGHASILAKLYNSKFIKENVDIFNLEYNVSNLSNKSFTDFCSKIAYESTSLQPELIAFGVYIWNEVFIQKIINMIRNEFKYKNKLLLGGPQITYARKFSLESFYPKVDMFIRGYAEDSFTNTIIKLSTNKYNDLKLIKGLHLANQIDLGLQSKTDLNSLPSPFLTNLISLDRSFIRWESQRGCPFKCTFCQHREINTNRESIQSNRLEIEINKICVSKVNDIAVIDPTFNSGKKYLSVLDCFIQNNYNGKLSLQTRLEMINDDFINKLVKMKNNGANVILECGIQTIINKEMKIIKRLNNLKRIELVVDKLHQNKIDFEISLIFGLPAQTLDSFKRSVDYCKSNLKPKNIYAWPLMILRGTELELIKNDFGLREETISMNDNQIELEKDRLFKGIPHVTSSNSFTKYEWLKMLNISRNL